MTPPLRTVARGLVLVTCGTLVLVLLWLILVASAFDVIRVPYSLRYVVYFILAAGLSLAFAGRCFALRLPPDTRAARAWAVLAVMLDGCGLLSAGTNFVLSEARVSLGTIVSVVTALFSLGGLVLRHSSVVG